MMSEAKTTVEELMARIRQADLSELPTLAVLAHELPTSLQFLDATFAIRARLEQLAEDDKPELQLTCPKCGCSYLVDTEE